MKISIVIPMYNCEKTIKSTIESVFNQKYKDYELILVNDGATDNTKCVVENIISKNDNIKFINTVNYGVSHARNVGIDNIDDQSDITIFLDSDDTMAINALEIINDNMENYDMVCYDYTMNGKYYTCKNFKQQNYKKYFYEELSKCLLFNQIWNKAYKSNIIKKMRFDESLSLGEDLDFNIRFLDIAKKYKYVSKNIYNYTLYNNGLSLKERDDIFNIKLNMLKNVNKFYEKNKYSKSYLNRMYFKAYLQGIYILCDKEKGMHKIDEYNEEILRLLPINTVTSDSLIYNFIVKKIIKKDRLILKIYLILYKLFNFIRKKNNKNK